MKLKPMTSINRHKVLISWLLSYSVILIIPIIISGVIYNSAEKIIKDESIKSSKAVINHVQQEIDVRMESVDKLWANIALNDDIEGFIGTADRESASYHYGIVKIVNELNSYVKIKDLISDFYIYVFDGNTVLQSGGIYSDGLLYEDMRRISGVGRNEWNEILRENHNRDIVALGNRDGNEAGGGNVLVMQSLPIGQSQKPAALLIIMLDRGMILDHLREVESVNQGSIYIVDGNNRVIASIGPETALHDFGYDAAPDSGESLLYSRDGKNSAVFFTKSGNNGWKYVSVIPTDALMEKAKNIRGLTLTGIYLCLFIGGILIFLFSRKNYSPVKRIVCALSAKLGKQYGDEKNEFNFIDRMITETIDENRRIFHLLDRQKGVLQSNYISYLLKGRPTGDIADSGDQGYGKVEFASDEFAVALLSIEEFGGYYEDGAEAADEKKTELIRGILRKVSEEPNEAGRRCHIVEMDDMFACLINFNGADPAGAQYDLERYIGKLHDIVLTAFHIITTISVSEIHHTRQGIPAAYKEALKAMQYKLIAGCGRIIFHSSVNATQKHYEYPIETELRLINAIKSGDRQKADTIISGVFDTNFNTGNASIYIAKCLIFDITGTLMKAINDIGFVMEGEFPFMPDPAQFLTDCRTIDEMKGRLAGVIEAICGRVEKNKKSHNIALIREIMQYIDRSFTDYNMNIALIAAKYNSNPAYLSRLFKEQTGQNLHDYINIVRLENAKRHMRDSNSSIGRIAVEVGFYNSNAFIRAFKKYEGITPGQYKYQRG